VSTAARDPVEKIDVDPSSSRYRQPTNFQQQQSQQSPAQGHAIPQTSGSSRQQGNYNHLSQEDQSDEQYNEAAEDAAADIDAGQETNYEDDDVNFLAERPCFRSYNGQLQGN